ncbi:hypothetical protein BGY98DRAFT_1003906 [Russula aff. rugulosa BPL654]|nr:hypothetical protein BGY98DRAFT_1003906 [Russula aff. rugulosa BPL654]
MSHNVTETSVSASAIKPIDSQSVHRITSGQVVIDLQTAAKELVENSLDAGATNVEVRFKDYGLKALEVIDNGSGIAPENYESIALKHHTSKLASFSDLTSVLTFGFRGEALSSLCALSESVTVTTATATQAPMGTILVFDKAGRLTSSNGKVARQRGTTVTVTGLFVPLPVRRKEFERHAKREFTKALNLLTAYALVPCARENNGVVLTVSNTPDGGKKTTQLRTVGATSVRASVGALWGPKQLDNLVDLDLSFEVVPEKSVLRRHREDGSIGNHRIRVEGLISKFASGSGRTGTDRQFFFINGRPCAPTKVQKAINEVYRTFNANQSPFVIADFVLPTDSCDINVSPDKRTILLHSENNLIEDSQGSAGRKVRLARSSFTSTPHTNELPATSPSHSDEPITTLKRPRSVSPDPVADKKETASEAAGSPTPAPTPESLTSSQRLAGPGRTPARVEQILSENTSGSTGSRRAVQMPTCVLSSLDLLAVKRKVKATATVRRTRKGGKGRADGCRWRWGATTDLEPNEMDDADVTELSSADLVEETMVIDSSESEDDETSKQPNDTSRSAAAATVGSPKSVQASDDLTSNTDILLSTSSEAGGTSESVVPATPSSPSKVSGILTEVVQHKTSSQPQPPQPATRSSDLESADLGVDDEKATATLARVLSKVDFGLMEVVGQFNRGFIVARLSKIGEEGLDASDDLFIVDQHAADEKYNFETLQATTRLESQRLFTPRVLELTAADELVALENMAVLQQNGFEVELAVDEPAGRRLRLLAQSVSKKTEFDVQDLEEILYLLRDRPSGTVVPCRMSTMVGASLNAKQMRTIIRHMGTMEQPWNYVGVAERRGEKAVDWATFVS